MRKIFEKLLSKVDGYGRVKAPKKVIAKFNLQYGKLLIGQLRLEDGRWYFEYSKEFKNQDQIKSLVDFPDESQSYESDTLWPFFVVRIPSLEQPAIKNIVWKEHIDKDNTAEMLKRFGKKSIANPFLLEPI